MAWPRCECSNQATFLAVAFALFMSMTVLQFGFALYANSDTLLVDCASMFVDSFTYAGNLWSSLRREDGDSDRARFALLTSGASIIVLYAITAWGLVGALESILEPKSKDVLHGDVVLWFGIIGLVVDALALLAFRRWGDDDRPDDAAALADEYGDVCAATFGDPGEDESPKESDEGAVDPLASVARHAAAMNLCTALSHVLADTIRSVTSVALGLYTTLDSSTNGTDLDAYATLLVTATVLFGSTALAADWCRLALELVRAGRRGGGFAPLATSDADAATSEEDTKECEMI